MKKRIITLLVALFAVVTLVSVLSLSVGATEKYETFVEEPLSSENPYSGMDLGTFNQFYDFIGPTNGPMVSSTAYTPNINMSKYKKVVATVDVYIDLTSSDYSSCSLYYFEDPTNLTYTGIKEQNQYEGKGSSTITVTTKKGTNPFPKAVKYGFHVSYYDGKLFSFSNFKLVGYYDEYTISYTLGDGASLVSYTPTTTYVPDWTDPIILPTATQIKRPGYIFDGWTINGNDIITSIDSSKVSGDITVTAKWTEAEAEIDFGSGNVKYYRTLKDAIAAVTDNTPRIIKLRKDITISSTALTITSGKNITIDTDGKTITFTNAMFMINGALTITSTNANRGKLTGNIDADSMFFVDTAGTLTLSNINVESTTVNNIIIQSYQNLILDNVTFADNTCAICDVYAYSGALTLKNVVKFTNGTLKINNKNSKVIANAVSLNNSSDISVLVTSDKPTADKGFAFATGKAAELKSCFTVANTWASDVNVEYVNGEYQLKLVTTADRYAKVTKNVATSTSYDNTLLCGGFIGSGYYKYSLVEYVIPKTSLDGAGTIYSMTYTASSKYSTGERRVEVYLKDIGSSDITDATIPVTEDDLVYSGRAVITGNKLTLTFDKPFEYNGGNLLIAMNDITGVINGTGAVVYLSYPTTLTTLAYSFRDSIAYTESDSVSFDGAELAPVPYIVFNKTSATSTDDTFEVGRQVGDVITGKSGIAKYSIDVSSFDYLPKTKNFSLKWLGTDPGVMTTFSLYSDRKGYLAIITKPSSPAGYYDFIISTGGKDDDEAKCETMTLAICPEAPEEGEGYEFFKGFIEIAEGYEVAKVDTFGNINWNDTLRTGDKYIHTQRYAVRLKATKTMPYSDYTVFTAPEFCSKEVQSKLTDGSFRTIRSGSGILDATKLVFANTANGWTIYNTTYNLYVGLTDSNTLAKTSTPFYWQYENSRLYAVRAENTSTSVTNRMASRPFSRFGKTAKYYLVIEDSNTFTLTQDGQKAVTTFWNRVEEAAHIKTISYTCNNQHILYCTDCRQQYYVDCVFDEATHKCVCGRVEPGYENTVLSVTFTSLEEESFKYKDDALNKEWYSADVKVTESNYEIDTMSYSFNGTDYRAGTEFSVDSINATFYVKIIAKGGYEYLYYFNGTEFVTPV